MSATCASPAGLTAHHLVAVSIKTTTFALSLSPPTFSRLVPDAINFLHWKKSSKKTKQREKRSPFGSLKSCNERERRPALAVIVCHGDVFPPLFLWRLQTKLTTVKNVWIPWKNSLREKHRIQWGNAARPFQRKWRVFFVQFPIWVSFWKKKQKPAHPRSVGAINELGKQLLIVRVVPAERSLTYLTVSASFVLAYNVVE